MQTNLYANSGILVTDPNKFIDLHCINQFLLASLTTKYISIEKTVFLKKDLLVATDQLPNNIPVTYFPYSFLYRMSKTSTHIT